MADSNASLVGAIDQLLLGADPAAVYRTLAAVLAGAPKAPRTWSSRSRPQR